MFRSTRTFVRIVALTKREHDKLPALVQASFAPIREGACPDPYSIVTSADKYRVMRCAYYREGFTHIAEDVLRHIVVPVTFFGVPVVGGAHPTLSELLHAVETDVGNQPKSAGFTIGGGCGLSTRDWGTDESSL